MKYRDLRDFAAQLEHMGELKRVTQPVSPHLEMTALGRPGAARRWAGLVVRPAHWAHGTPVLANLFGTPRRVALGMGAARCGELRDIGTLLARLKEPEPPQGLKDAGRLVQMMKAVWEHEAGAPP
jgi:4-hydroxy-3-polyprenylbenzoate decarboxylase